MNKIFQAIGVFLVFLLVTVLIIDCGGKNNTTNPTQPSTPVLSAPANNAANQPTSLTLSWGAVSGAASYSVQVSKDANFASIVDSQSNLTAASIAVSGLAVSSTYYWHVNASNSVGASAWSGSWSFSTSAPSCMACHTSLPPHDSMHSAHSRYDCSICHQNTSKSAIDSFIMPVNHPQKPDTIKVPFSLDTLVTLGWRFIPRYNSTTRTCSDVYCHGYFPTGDSGTPVSADSTVWSSSHHLKCGKCHNLDSLYLTAHHAIREFLPIPFIDSCTVCHPGYSLLDSTVVDSTHINGHLNVMDSCTTCHEAWSVHRDPEWTTW